MIKPLLRRAYVLKDTSQLSGTKRIGYHNNYGVFSAPDLALSAVGLLITSPHGDYGLSNPAEDSLVKKAKEWPGFLSLPFNLGEGKVIAKHPSHLLL